MTHINTRSNRIPDDMLEKWQKIVDILADVLEVPTAIITRVSPPMIEVLRSAETGHTPYHSGLKAEMSGHYCETVIHTTRPLQVSYAPEDPQWNNAPEIQYNMMAYLGFPLRWPTGEIFGTICVLDNKRNPFGDRFEKLIGEFRELVQAHLALVAKNHELRAALNEIRTLREMLPICCICKKVRDDEGYWKQIEEYLERSGQTALSHCICPDCAREHYSEYDLGNA